MPGRGLVRLSVRLHVCGADAAVTAGRAVPSSHAALTARVLLFFPNVGIVAVIAAKLVCWDSLPPPLFFSFPHSALSVFSGKVMGQQGTSRIS